MELLGGYIIKMRGETKLQGVDILKFSLTHHSHFVAIAALNSAALMGFFQ
jgi:hypothetical protein